MQSYKAFFKLKFRNPEIMVEICFSIAVMNVPGLSLLVLLVVILISSLLILHGSLWKRLYIRVIFSEFPNLEIKSNENNQLCQ
jgi:hypothetical protein